jgi:hypothetical protein
MHYQDGQAVTVGDQVTLGGSPGIVVCSIDDGAYSDEHPENQWGYLGVGVMIDFPEFGLIHFVEPDPDLSLIARKPSR